MTCVLVNFFVGPLLRQLIGVDVLLFAMLDDH